MLAKRDKTNLGAQISLPGFKEKHVKVDNNNGLLTISAERKTKVKSTGEKRYRSFLLTVSDPNLKDVVPVFKDGILTFERGEK